MVLIVRNDQGRLVERGILTSRGVNNRTGVRTDVIEQVDRESQGFRVINRAIIPVVRSRSISFVGTEFRPNTKVFTFFDKVNVNAHVTPFSSSFSDATTPVAGSQLITDASGSIEGTFLIPDPKVAGNLQFQTGELEFRITSSSLNLTGSAASADTNSTADALTDQLTTAGSTIYFAKGILETEQETIIATRNARVVTTQVNQSNSFNTSEVISEVDF